MTMQGGPIKCKQFYRHVISTAWLRNHVFHEKRLIQTWKFCMVLFLLPHNTISKRSSMINHMLNLRISSLSYDRETDIEAVDNSVQYLTSNPPDFTTNVFP